jgi:hypothetical protein
LRFNVADHSPVPTKLSGDVLLSQAAFLAGGAKVFDYPSVSNVMKCFHLFQLLLRSTDGKLFLHPGFCDRFCME